MCGIAGIIAPNEAIVRQALPALMKVQRHRGPDDAGEHHGRLAGLAFGLGHTRLSILDLSPAGHQPMVHPLTGDVLVFNGEIYNHLTLRKDLEGKGARFVGHSDSEVLLHALTEWGPAALPRLQGMFAFAFLDARNQRLLLARDSIGIKPLYLAELPQGGLVFASEVRALLETGLVPPQINPRGVAGLLAYGAVQGPLTMFHNVADSPPGHYQLIAVENGSVRRSLHSFWSPPPIKRDVTAEQSVSAVKETVEAAVMDHLVSDVPVGLFLSSGLDSTIVAGVAARHASHLRSFTVGFAENPDLSELELAAETAKLFQLDHSQIDVPARAAEESTTAWLSSLDLPSLDGFNVFLISQFVRAAGIKVALSGQGGDELFGGYPSFADVPRIHRWFRVAHLVPRSLRRRLAAFATTGRTEAVRNKAIDLADSDGDLLSLYLRRRRATSSAHLRSLGIEPRALGLTDDYLPPEAVDARLLAQTDPVSAVSRMETRFYLGNMLLRDGDVNGMRHSLEIRVPLLDQRLLDLAMAIPGDIRLPEGRANKHLLRRAFPEFLRPSILQQRKRGFTLPIARWMLGPLRELCEAGIAKTKTLGFLSPAAVDATWSGFLREPQGSTWSQAFILAVLGLYCTTTRATA